MTRSRSRNLAFGLLALVAVALSATAHSGPSNERVTRLRTICESPIGFSRRAALLDDLRKKDTSSSRNALEDMAASDDEVVATQAIARAFAVCSRARGPRGCWPSASPKAQVSPPIERRSWAF